MDRRRFSPSAEGLDSRILLSTASRPQNVPVANLHQKTLRIDHLALALNSLQEGRDVDPSIVGSLQADLRGLVGRLKQPSGATLTAAQLQFRSTVSHASISQEDAAGLRATFRAALASAGTPTAILEDLSANMDTLVKFDSNGADPAQLAANDYAVILQTVLGVGRPIRTPVAPMLSSTDDSGAKGDHATTVTRPHLTGHYDTNAVIHLIDENNVVLGTGPVTAGGQYSVSPAAPLSLGKHTLRIQAFDANNDPSPPSLPIRITIVPVRVRRGVTTTTTTTVTPAGPLGF